MVLRHAEEGILNAFLVLGMLIHSNPMGFLEASRIEQAFARLNELLAERETRAEIYLVGGAVMCLVHHARPATKDVDGWFTEPQLVRALASVVADELALDENWLNDAAKGVVPPGGAFETWREMSHLGVLTADAKTLLAMKCMAARTGVDTEDIRFLSRLLGLKSASHVLAVVAELLPVDRIPVRTQLLLDELFDQGAS